MCLMKKIAYILLPILAGFTLTGCDDLLDVYPLDRMSPETFYKSETELQAYGMNLYAMLKEDGKVVVEGVVFYWNPVDGDTQKSAVIATFKDLDECLTWISNESAAKEECVEILNENC